MEERERGRWGGGTRWVALPGPARCSDAARGDSGCREYLTREIEVTANITVRLHTEITDGHGEQQLEALTL